MMLLSPPRVLPFSGGSVPPYVAAILADNPLAYWRFGELVGVMAVDQKGASPGTYVGAPTLGIAGALTHDANTAVQFDGATQSVSVVDSAPFRFAGSVSFTIEAWLNQVPDATFRRAISCENAGGLGWQMFSQNADYGIQRRDGVGSSAAEVFASIPAGWQLLAATYDGANLRLYRNGALIAGPTASAHVLPADTTFAIAKNGGAASHFFAGGLDEIAIYATALSQARLQAHFDAR